MSEIDHWQLLVSMGVLLSGGVLIGRIWWSANSAHSRINSLEKLIQFELRSLRADLKEILREGWRHCPFVVDKHGRLIEKSDLSK